MRLSPMDELDVRWFWLEAGSELGLRCPLGMQLELAEQRLLGCDYTPQGPDMDRSAAMIRRYDAIRDKLAAMSRRNRQTLIAAYCGKAEGLGSLDRLGPVVLLTAAARGAHLRDMAKRGDVMTRVSAKTLSEWLRKRFKTDQLLKSRALEEADEMLTKACEDWRAR